MIYPHNFEQKISFNEIRTLLRERCLSSLGREKVDDMAFSTDPHTINEWLEQTKEFRHILEEADNFPIQNFFDVRESVSRIRLEGTHLEEQELFDLRQSLSTIHLITTFLQASTPQTVFSPTLHEAQNEIENVQEESTNKLYPALYKLTEGVITFPQLIQHIDRILDKFGHIRDGASPELIRIRQDLSRTEGSISRTLYNILRNAQSEGLVEKDVTPTMRDGRLVIPVAPALKRRLHGIVHDESASGKTVFIEPTEVVEANNKIRELEADERREIIRILTNMAKQLRPHVKEILSSFGFLATIDFIRSKAETAKLMNAFEPVVVEYPHIDWIRAVHPLLQMSLQKQQKQVTPLDITLTEEQRILIISGPNAGGKSVCLKTVGLLQYMLQCGLSVPVGDRSVMGVFQNIMIDVGDEQSIENDLSTYSSHLMNMKTMMRHSNSHTLLLIDEFGTGTEPQIGGAIAEAVLKQFCNKQAYGVITTHYQNLKHFADTHKGVVNGAMLYDRNEMKALFQLAIGQPGSSFAIEIARKTGIPETVISDASEIVGSDYIQSDKYLQDIVRDKRYWEHKRQAIHQREKELEKTFAKYETDIADLTQSRKEIMQKAKEQAEELLRESNKRIENVIRQIRESQAEKEETKRIREEFNTFKEEISNIDTTANDEKIARKIEQILRRKERYEKRKKDKEAEKAQQKAAAMQIPLFSAGDTPIAVGDTVRIKGLSSVGTVETIDGKTAVVIFGDMHTKVRTERLERTDTPREEPIRSARTSRITRATIEDRQKGFHQDLDVRGMRGDEAIHAVQQFVDNAILVGMPHVRILHGKGNGILRQLIRQYLSTVPNITAYRDEHVQFGGAGITVVDF